MQLRDRLLSFCAAGWGLAIGIALEPFWIRPAPPGQPQGLMTSLGIDASASYRFFFGLLLIPFVTALATRPLVRRLCEPDARAWARNASAAAMLLGFWFALITQEVLWVVIPPAIAMIAFTLLHRVRADFTRRDALLLPTVMMLYMALCDATELAIDKVFFVAVAIAIAVRLAIVFVSGGAGRSATGVGGGSTGLEPSLCFALAPIGLALQTHFLSRDQRHFGWPPILLAIVTPFLLRFFLRDSAITRKRIRMLVGWVVYPIAVYGYVSASGQLAAEGMPRIDFFEDAQHIAPAGEMLRGETPYREIIPPHGLLQDGYLDYLALKKGPVNVGQAMRARASLTALSAVASYALAAAATGSPDVGIAVFFLAAMLAAAAGTIRVLPALAALAFICAAMRLRKPKVLIGAGAFFVVAGITSIDFSAYTLLAILFAIFRFPGSKLAAFRWSAIGALAVGIPVTLWFAIRGFLVDFFRVSIFEVATLGPVYALPTFNAPQGFLRFRMFPEVFASVFDRTSTQYFLWAVIVLALAVAVTSKWRTTLRRRAMLEPLVIIAVFIAICGLSYAERHHLHHQFAVPPLIGLALWRMRHARHRLVRAAVPLLVVAMLMLAYITTHLAILGWLRRSRTATDPGWVEVGLPRAQGAYFKERDVAIIDTVNRYVQSRLRPDETFFDFTNRGLLYFIVDRDIPLRQIEVAFYQSEDLQNEVIATLEANRKIRAAIVPKPAGDTTGVDNVSNTIRAPLVWQYLQANFEPDVEEGEVAIWRRK